MVLHHASVRWWRGSAALLAVAGMVWALPGLAGPTDAALDPATPDTLAAVDTAAIVAVALAEYDPGPNGPLTELADDLECIGSDERSRVPCGSAMARPVLVEHAMDSGLMLVRLGESMVECRWGEPEDPHRVGLRLVVRAPETRDGEQHVSVVARCMGTRGGFFHAVYYRVEQVEGEWVVAEVVGQVITE